jgi:ADP-ribose pyrophosphatase YjhB (NUDIX family)
MKESHNTYLVNFPIAYHTVDIAILRRAITGSGIEVLLAKKNTKDSKWRFPGGFVDISDNSAEDAALREAFEETHMQLFKNTLRYIGSFKINDPRFENRPHKIITSFFQIKYNSGNAGIGNFDDIRQIEWFNLDTLPEIEPFHDILIKSLISANVPRVSDHVEHL